MYIEREDSIVYGRIFFALLWVVRFFYLGREDELKCFIFDLVGDLNASRWHNFLLKTGFTDADWNLCLLCEKDLIEWYF